MKFVLILFSILLSAPAHAKSERPPECVIYQISPVDSSLSVRKATKGENGLRYLPASGILAEDLSAAEAVEKIKSSVATKQCQALAKGDVKITFKTRPELPSYDNYKIEMADHEIASIYDRAVALKVVSSLREGQPSKAKECTTIETNSGFVVVELVKTGAEDEESGDPLTRRFDDEDRAKEALDEFISSGYCQQSKSVFQVQGSSGAENSKESGTR